VACTPWITSATDRPPVRVVAIHSSSALKVASPLDVAASWVPVPDGKLVRSTSMSIGADVGLRKISR
jgi:hypothetical protein